MEGQDKYCNTVWIKENFQFFHISCSKSDAIMLHDIIRGFQHEMHVYHFDMIITVLYIEM